MKKETQHHLPNNTLILKPIGDNEWGFEYTRVTQDEWERFYAVLDLWNSGRKGNIAKAERGYRKLINEYPEFIDAYHHLAILLDETDHPQEAFELWQRAVDLCLSCFPASFSIGKDLVPWIFLDNRPFLRAYHALGLALMENSHAANALSIFTNILALNPNDNQGVRSLAINCYFALSQPWEVLEISQRYQDDIMPEVRYGSVLALYQIGLKNEAEAALSEAVLHLPLVAKEIIKKQHRQPKRIDPGYVTVGGPDEAYSYWIGQGRYWKTTPGAIDFIRDYLTKAT